MVQPHNVLCTALHPTWNTIMHIFISYSSKDRPIVKELAEEIPLLLPAAVVWFDQAADGLSGGQDWWDEICRRIRACEVFLSAISPREMASEPCRREREYATALGKPILPVQVADLDFKDLELRLQRTHVVDFRQGNREQRLALRTTLEKMPPSPLLPPNAHDLQPPAPLDPIGVMRDRIRTLTGDARTQRDLINDLYALAQQHNHSADVLDLVTRLRTRRDVLAVASLDLLEGLFPVREEPNAKLRRLFDQGHKLAFAALDVQPAVAVFRQVIEIAPSGVWALLAQGCIKYYEGIRKNISPERNGALADFNEAVRLDPFFAPAYVVRGDALRYASKYDLAFADLNQAIRLEPTYAMAYFVRGYARYARQDDQGAIADFSDAIRLDPSYGFAHYMRGTMYSRGPSTSAEHLNRAIADFTQALHLDPKASAYSNRARAREWKGDFDGAIADLTDALRLDSNLLNCVQRGNVRMLKGDASGAIADYTEAIRREPTGPFAPYTQRADALVANGDLNGALADLAEYLRQKPESPHVLYQRGQLLEGARRFREAATDYKRAIDVATATNMKSYSAESFNKFVAKTDFIKKYLG